MFKFIVLWAVLVAVLSSCGREAPEAYEAEETAREVTFSILAPVSYTHAIRTAAGRLARGLAEYGIEFSIELTTFDGVDEAEEELSRLRVALMANRDVPDLVINAGFPVRSFSESGLLADFYSLIDASERFSRSDFFESALEAFEMGGGLYLLPLSFGFDLIGINNSLSDELLSRLSEKDSINMHDLIKLYNAARHDGAHARWARVPIHNFGNALHQIYVYAYQFIDFDAQASGFLEDEFVEFLRSMRLAQAGREEYTFRGYVMWGNALGSYEEFANIAQEHPFINMAGQLNPVLPLLGSSHSYFSDFLPLADRDGRLMLRTNLQFSPYGQWGAPTWGSAFAPAGSENQSFLLDFVYELVLALTTYISRGFGTPSFVSFGPESISTPIFQSMADRYYSAVFDRFLAQDRGQNPRLHEGSTRNDALARVAKLNARPMVFVDVEFMSSLFSDTVYRFLIGYLTPEQAAREMHNRVTLWLIE